MPRIIILAGPNGAGKSTSAPGLLSQNTVFLNADEIAKGLMGYSAAIERRVCRALVVETTLASRTLALRVARLQAAGYRFYQKRAERPLALMNRAITLFHSVVQAFDKPKELGLKHMVFHSVHDT